MLSERGFEPAAIGFVTAVSALGFTLAVPVWGHLADVTLGRPRALQVAAIGAGAAMAAFGLPVARTEIATFAGTQALVIERFDRLRARDGRLIRLPQEDCCQALSVPPTRKYQSEGGPGIVEICGLLQGSDEPQRDRANFLKATILFWLIGATDGHAKNFSIALMPGGRFTMTPLYDVLTVQPSLDAGQLQTKDMKLAMRAGKSRRYKGAEI